MESEQFSKGGFRRIYAPDLWELFCFFSLTRNGAMRIRGFIVPTVCTRVGQ